MIRKLLLILRFYYSAMFFFCMAVSIGFAWVVSNHGPTIIPWCLLGKAAVYPLYLYVWIVQRYGDEFFYYRNLGVRRPSIRSKTVPNVSATSVSTPYLRPRRTSG